MKIKRLALHEAVLEEEVMEDMRAIGDRSLSVLRCALDRGDATLAKMLIDAGGDVNCQSSKGETALHLAVKEDFVLLTKQLISLGADVGVENSRGLTPLQHAMSFRDNLEILKVLVEAGADVEDRDSFGRTVLHLATSKNDADFVRQLAGHARVDAADTNGQTPLHYAAILARVEAAEELLNSGADVNARDANGDTPLHHVTRKKSHVRLLELFLSRKADVNAFNNRKEIPLCEAILYGDFEMIEMLVEHGSGFENVNIAAVFRGVETCE